MKLCGLAVLLKPVFDGMLGLVGEQRRFERGQLLVGLQPTGALGGLQRTGGGPAQRHVGVAPSFQVATDAADSPYHVLDGVGAGECMAELRRQAEPVDGEHLVEPFENALGDAGRRLLDEVMQLFVSVANDVRR